MVISISAIVSLTSNNFLSTLFTNQSLNGIALRIEWCKSRARAMRFTEEVQLLQEEMMRVLRFFRWQESWWRSNGPLIESKKDISNMRAEGLHAYAERQAALRYALHSHFQYLWRNVPGYVKLVTDSMAT